MKRFKSGVKFTKKEAVRLGIGIAFAVFSGMSLAQIQIEAANQQAQRVKVKAKLSKPAEESVAPLSEEETDDIGPQFVVRQRPRRDLFEVAFDTQFLQSSNLYLTEADKVKGTLMLSTFQLAIAPKPMELGDALLGWKGGYRHQKFNYGKFSQNEKSLNDLDFDVSSFFLQGYYIGKKNWMAVAGIEQNRLLNAAAGKYDEFYSEWVPNLSLEKQLKLGEKSTLSLTATGAWHISHVDPPEPSQNDRVDEALTVSLSHELVSDLSVQPYYRLQFTQYTRKQGRQDVTQSVGVSLGYAFNKWSSVRFSAGFEGRDSSDASINDYRKLDTGLGLSFQAKF